ncbi:MAG: MarR family transcriptional regulator [Chlorobi bacterium]|nr:MarR family transcriptional regulator [Chlorobiota bacterium]
METSENKYELVYYKFLGLSHKVEDKVKKALKPLELTHPQLNVLYLLYHKNPKVLSPKDIKESLIVNQPDITRLMDRLEKKGLVYRETCKENRRKVDIGITEKGKQVFELSHKKGKEAVGNFFSDFLNESESKTFYKLLNKIKI